MDSAGISRRPIHLACRSYSQRPQQWGHVEGVPVDVYYCDFKAYGPPDAFPTWDVCCIRTEAAWWIIFTQVLFRHLQVQAQNGELPQDLFSTVTMVNERLIGAWLLVRDRALDSELAMSQMDEYLVKKYGEDFKVIQGILEQGRSEDEEIFFKDGDFGKEPLDEDSLNGGSLLDNREPVRAKWTAWYPAWMIRSLKRFDGLKLSQRMTILSILVVVVVILVIEGPRLRSLYRQVYGPGIVDLQADFPAIYWVDSTDEAVLSRPDVARALYQAIQWRNPFKAATPLKKIGVRKVQRNSEVAVYRWDIIWDAIAEEPQVHVEMIRCSKKEIRILQNTVSEYRNLRFMLCSKLFMKWGHNGRFIVLFTGLCLGGLGLLARRLVRQIKSVESDATIRGYAAGSRILEAVAQDAKAAQNLTLFNQERRLHRQGLKNAEGWEQEAFDWIDRNVDPETGQTRRKMREDSLKDDRL